MSETESAIGIHELQKIKHKIRLEKIIIILNQKLKIQKILEF